MAEKGISDLENEDRKWCEYGGNLELYTGELAEVLEQVYCECPKPSHAQRPEMICEYLILSTSEHKKIKLWFQKCRCHEKQKKEAIQLLTVNEKLAATKKLLLVENERLHKELLQLENENKYIRQLLQNVSESITSFESASNPQNSFEAADNSKGVLLLAEENMRKFLTVAKGCAVGWFQIPRMKALHCIGQLAEEMSGKLILLLSKEPALLSKEPALLQSFCQILSRDLNGLIISANSIKNLGTISNYATSLSFFGGILCVEVSIVFQCDRQDTLIAQWTKNLTDNINVPCLMAQTNPSPPEAVTLADWICESFRALLFYLLGSANQGQYVPN